MGTIKLKKVSTETEQMSTSAAVTDSNTENISVEKRCWDDPAVLKEFSEKTNATSRHYKLNNGTAKSIISAAPSNYFDESENQWKPIDNSLTEKEWAYESTGGKYKTEITKPEKGKSIKMTASGIAISWEYLGRQSTSEVQAQPFAFDGDTVPTTLEVEPEIKGALQSKSSKATYENADKDTDIEYSLAGNNIKENIIVKEKAEEYRYLFALNTQGLKLRVSEDNESLELYTETSENGETVTKTEATIPAPFMYDANGESSDDVYFELAPETDGKYTFAVVASAEWINEENRAFPVTIDPQIVTGGSEYFSKTVQYRNIYTSYSSGCYQTSYSDWYTVSNYSYIRVSRTASQEYKTILTIDKAGLPKLDYPVSSVKLVLTPCHIPQSGYCNIGGKSIYLSGMSKKTVDITAKYNGASNSFTVVVEPRSTYTVNAEFYASGANAPYIEVEYLINGKKKEFIQQFTLAGGATGRYDIATGDASIAFEDVPASDSLLGIGISHVYKKSAEDLHAGKNFRLSLNETLSKTGAGALEADYVYTDATGMKHGFKDTYYYIDETNKKISVNKSLVAVELDGRLTYTAGGTTYEVKKEQQTKSGLKAVTQYDGFENVKWYEQRTDEQKQLQQQIDSYRSVLNEFVIADKNTGTIFCSLRGGSSSGYNYEGFMGCLFNTRLLLTESEAINYHSLMAQKTELDSYSTTDGSEGEDESAVEPPVTLDEQKQNIAWQLMKLRRKSTEYEEQIEKYYKEYVNLDNQLKQLTRQMPVNYLTDGALIKGFNEEGRLVAIFDNYENMIMVEHDEEGKIVGVYDGEDKQIVFEYRPNGLLNSITDTRGRRVEYGYDENDKLTSVNKTGDNTLNLSYDSNNPDFLTSITTSDKMQSVLGYTNGLLSTVTAKSLIDGIIQGQEPAADAVTISEDAVTISECSFSFGDNLTVLTDDKNNKRYYKIDDLGDVYEYYEEENGKIVAAEKYDYVPYEKDNVQSAKRSSLYTKAYTSFTSADFTGGETVNTVLDEFNNPSTKTISARPLSNGATQGSEGTTQEAVVTYEYDDNHKCVKETAVVTIKQGASELNTYTQITAYNYNAAGSVVRKESYTQGEEYTMGKSIEETVYDEKGNAVKSFSYNSLDSSSKFYTESDYAENGQTLADYDETGENKTEYEYISGTNVVRSQKLPNGSKFAYGHDESDTVTSITQSTEEGEENSTQTRYTCGVVTELVSGNNKVNYEYDAKRRLSKVKLNGAEYVTIETADATETTDETVYIDYIARSSDDNNSDRYEVTKNKRGDVVSVRYVYDSKTAETPAYAELYTNEYDIKNRLSKVKQGSTVLEGNEYDELDRLEEHQFNGHVHTIEYSEYNQRAKETISFGGSGTDKQEYEYTYDDEKASRPQTGMTVGAFGEGYEQDVAGRNVKLTQTLNGNSYTKRYGYYKQGDHATKRVNTIYYGKNGVTDGKVTYTYDGMGNIISVNENGKQRYKYTYDKLNRIISEKDLYKNKEVCYTYDNNGNILTKSIDGEVTEYRYTEGSDRLVQYGTETISYDGMGNPTTYKGLTCTWEKGRQLKSIEDEANRVEYEYDVFGLRKTKKIYEPSTAQSPTETTNYIYENGKLLRQVTGGEVLDFYYGSEGVIGFKLSGSSVLEENGNYLYRKNLFGDIIGIINESGALVYEYAYSAFGKSDKEEETGIGAKNPFRYRGYYYDTETGLYYLKSRYYDPETGRFITIDDIQILSISKEVINGLNLYCYCNNNPVSDKDESGYLFGFLLALLVGGIVGALVSVAGTFIGDIANNIWNNGFNFAAWEFSNWQTYLGAAIGGFIGGALGVAFPGSYVLVAGVTGAISTFATDVLEYATGVGNHTWASIFMDTVLSGVISAAFGKLTQGFVVKGINAGRNSFQQVFKSGVTKAWRYGYRMSLKTAGKGFIYLGLSSFNVGWLIDSILGGIVG